MQVVLTDVAIDAIHPPAKIRKVTFDSREMSLHSVRIR